MPPPDDTSRMKKNKNLTATEELGSCLPPPLSEKLGIENGLLMKNHYHLWECTMKTALIFLLNATVPPQSNPWCSLRQCSSCPRHLLLLRQTKIPSFLHPGTISRMLPYNRGFCFRGGTTRSVHRYVSLVALAREEMTTVWIMAMHFLWQPRNTKILLHQGRKIVIACGASTDRTESLVVRPLASEQGDTSCRC